jgi:hypothetical protein
MYESLVISKVAAEIVGGGIMVVVAPFIDLSYLN